MAMCAELLNALVRRPMEYVSGPKTLKIVVASGSAAGWRLGKGSTWRCGVDPVLDIMFAVWG